MTIPVPLRRLYRWLDIASSPAPPLRLVGRLITGGLGLCFVIAALSLWPQLDGLIGPDGLSPAHDQFARYAQRFGEDKIWRMPSLMWLSPTLLTAQILCALTVLVGLAAMFARAAPMLFVTASVLYLSLFYAALPFTGFQWDLLLIETGAAAVLLLPFTLRRAPLGPRLLGVFALRLVLFKLVFSSGAKKWLANDGTWRELDALNFHFFTQPLPNPLSPFFHALPDGLLAWLTGLTLIVQIIVPFFLFAPRSYRLTAAWLIILHQLGIAATGNFAFFNLLTLVLCLSAWDDQHLRSLLGTLSLHFRRRVYSHQPAPRPGRTAVFVAVVTPWLFLQALELAQGLGVGQHLPAALYAPHDAIKPFRIVNGYGLFVRMTTKRPEIVYEATQDGTTWLAYELPHKPGDVSRGLPVVAPHQPRLDWQLWFAALNPRRPAPFAKTLQRRLLDAEPAVLALFEHAPFGADKPLAVRARLYDYRFSDGDAVWDRTPAGVFLRPLRR